MNTSKTFSIIIPYLILAMLFVAMASYASCGFATSLESNALAAASQMARGSSLYAAGWGQAAVCAPLLQPVYSAAVTLGGGVEGIFYLTRVLAAGIAFVVALAAYRGLVDALGSVKALIVAATFMLIACLAREGLGVYGIAPLAAFGSLALGLVAKRALVQDKGEASGYGRVLCPVLSGVLGLLAMLFSLWVGIVLIIVFAASAAIAAIYKQREGLFQLAWVAAGALLGAAVYLIVVLGLGEPSQVMGAIAASYAAQVPSIVSFSSMASMRALLSRLAFAAAVVLLLAFESDVVAGRFGQCADRAARIASTIVVILAAAAVVLPAFGARLTQMNIDQGPAKELSVDAATASLYADAVSLAQDANDATTVRIDGGESSRWAYLLFDAARDDESPQLVLAITEGSQDDQLAAQLDGYGLIGNAPACQLYKRAGTIGAITQG